MTTYAVEITCPTCGGPMLHDTAEVIAVDRSVSDARCDVCLTMWRFTLVATATEIWPVDRSTPEARQNRARQASIIGSSDQQFFT